MNCHECAHDGIDRPAVGLCRFCYVGLCKDHLVSTPRCSRSTPATTIPIERSPDLPDRASIPPRSLPTRLADGVMTALSVQWGRGWHGTVSTPDP
jgi:hypothetical protein